jgi:hypothetical protein
MTSHPFSNISSEWQRLLEQVEALPDYPDSLKLLIQAITDSEPLPCDEAQASLPYLVDHLLGNYSEPPPYPDVVKHLNWCAECKSIYMDLLDFSVHWENIPDSTMHPVTEISLSRYSRLVAKDVLAMLYPGKLHEFDSVINTITDRDIKKIAEPPSLYHYSISTYHIIQALYESTSQIALNMNISSALQNKALAQEILTILEHTLSVYPFPEDERIRISKTYLAIILRSLSVLRYVRRS